MIRRPPRSTLSSSSAASDVYKRQVWWNASGSLPGAGHPRRSRCSRATFGAASGRGWARRPWPGVGRPPTVAVVVATFGPAVGTGCAALQPAPEAPRVTVAVRLDVLAGSQVGQPVQDGVIGLVGPELIQVDQRAFGEQIPVLRPRPSGFTGPVATRQPGRRGQLLLRDDVDDLAAAAAAGGFGDPDVVLAEPVDTRGGGSALVEQDDDADGHLPLVRCTGAGDEQLAGQRHDQRGGLAVGVVGHSATGRDRQVPRAGCPAPARSSTSTSAVGPWGNAIPADRSGAGGQHSHRPRPGSGAGWVAGDQGGVRAHPADLGRSPRGVQRPGPAGQRLGEEPGVVGGEVGPLPGDVVLVEDGLDRADRLAGSAVDALVRLDVERSLPFVDAVDRALFDAGPVQHVDARLGDDVGHPLLLSVRSRWTMCEFIGQLNSLLGSGGDRCDRPRGLGGVSGVDPAEVANTICGHTNGTVRGYRAGSGHRSPTCPFPPAAPANGVPSRSNSSPTPRVAWSQDPAASVGTCWAAQDQQVPTEAAGSWD